MKKTKIFISLVIMICLVFSLSACTQDDTSSEISTTEELNAEPDARLNAAEINDDDNNYDDGDKNEDIAPDDNYHDPAADDDGSNDGDGNLISPGTHDGYYHEVGEAAFYTKHDINQWLSPDEKNPGYTFFNFTQMLYDIWVVEGGGGSVIESQDGYYYINEVTGEKKKLLLLSPDEEDDRIFREITILHVCDGVDYTSTFKILDCPQPHDYDYYHIYVYHPNVIYKDMAPLMLLAIERMDDYPQQNNALGDLDLGDNFITY